MALQLAIQHSTGITLNYWKISTTNVCWYVGRWAIYIDGYPDRQTRLNGATPVTTIEYIYLKDANFTIQPTDNLLQTSYAKLKTLPEWSGAIDV